MVVKDKKTGKSLGYAYMEINSSSIFKEALEKLQSENFNIGGRNIVVRDASKKFESSRFNKSKQSNYEKDKLNSKNGGGKKRDKKAEEKRKVPEIVAQNKQSKE